MHGQPAESAQLLEYTCFAAVRHEEGKTKHGQRSEPAEQGYKPELTAPWPLTEKAASPWGGEKATKERESEQGGEQKAEGPM